MPFINGNLTKVFRFWNGIPASVGVLFLFLVLVFHTVPDAHDACNIASARELDNVKRTTDTNKIKLDSLNAQIKRLENNQELMQGMSLIIMLQTAQISDSERSALQLKLRAGVMNEEQVMQYLMFK